MYDRTLFNERENKLIDIWSEIYNAFNMVEYKDGKWCISGPDYNESFSSSEEMLKFLEEDVKESLLVYALNGKLSELDIK